MVGIKLKLNQSQAPEPESNNVLYTGTGKMYLTEMLGTFGEFTHRGSPYVYLYDDPFYPCGIAKKRARFYDDSPIILVVDADKLRDEVIYKPEIKTRALNIGSFLPHEIYINCHGRTDDSNHIAIDELKDQVVKCTEKEIQQKLAEFLSALLE